MSEMNRWFDFLLENYEDLYFFHSIFNVLIFKFLKIFFLMNSVVNLIFFGKFRKGIEINLNLKICQKIL
jgi:hypothetical protein